MKTEEIENNVKNLPTAVFQEDFVIFIEPGDFHIEECWKSD